MSVILQDLAAGRIDAAEAAPPDRRAERTRRAAAHAAAGAPAPRRQAEPTNEDLAAADPTASGIAADADAWAADRSAAVDRLRSRPVPRARAPPPAAPDPAPEPEPERREQPTTTVPPRKQGSGGVTKISVRAVGRRVRIIGETAVATLSADGPHVLRRNGSVLEVSSDGELGASLDGFCILRGAAQPRRLPCPGPRQGAADQGQPEHPGRRRGDRGQPEHRTGAAPRQGPGDRRRGEAARCTRDQRRADPGRFGHHQGRDLAPVGRASGPSRARCRSSGRRLQCDRHGEAQLGKVSWSGGPSAETSTRS